MTENEELRLLRVFADRVQKASEQLREATAQAKEAVQRARDTATPE